MKKITGFVVNAMLAFTVNATDVQVSAGNKHNTNQTKVDQVNAATADATSSNTTHKVVSQETTQRKNSVKTAKHSDQADKETQEITKDTPEIKKDSRS